jgi:hypothetical protein
MCAAWVKIERLELPHFPRLHLKVAHSSLAKEELSVPSLFPKRICLTIATLLLDIKTEWTSALKTSPLLV